MMEDGEGSDDDGGRGGRANKGGCNEDGGAMMMMEEGTRWRRAGDVGAAGEGRVLHEFNLVPSALCDTVQSARHRHKGSTR